MNWIRKTKGVSQGPHTCTESILVIMRNKQSTKWSNKVKKKTKNIKTALNKSDKGKQICTWSTINSNSFNPNPHISFVSLYVRCERNKKHSLFILMCLSVARVLEWPWPWPLKIFFLSFMKSICLFQRRIWGHKSRSDWLGATPGFPVSGVKRTELCTCEGCEPLLEMSSLNCSGFIGWFQCEFYME